MALPAMTRGELATLGIHIDARGAITTTKALAGELDALGKKGAAVAGVAGGSVAPAMRQIEGATSRARLSVGRLGNQFGSLVASMTGVHPVAMNLVGVLGNFVASGAIMAGVLGGLAAVTIAYKKLTEDARDAAKATRDLISDLKEWASLRDGGVDPLQQTVDITRATEATLRAQLAASRAGGVGQGAATGQHGGTGVRAPTVAEIAEATRNRMNAEDRLEERRLEELRRRNEHSFDMSRQLPERGRGGRDRKAFDASSLSGMIDFQMDRVLARGPNAQDWLDKRIQGAATAPFQMTPKAPIMSGLQRDAANGVGGREIPAKLDAMGRFQVRALEGVTQGLLTGLSQVASAMLLGGGGRGSQIGGSIGGAILGTIGIGGGPIGNAIGGVVGTLAGSLLGGLFDKKKKVANGLDMMASQLARVNQQLRNLPSGYKVNRMQYDATVPETPPTNPGKPPGPGGPAIPGVPESPNGSVVIYGDIKVMANNTAQFVREIGRALIQEGARGGVTGLALAGG